MQTITSIHLIIENLRTSQTFSFACPSLEGEDLGSWRDFRMNTYIPDAEDWIDIRFKLDVVWSRATGENWRNDMSLTLHQGGP